MNEIEYSLIMGRAASKFADCYNAAEDLNKLDGIPNVADVLPYRTPQEIEISNSFADGSGIPNEREINYLKSMTGHAEIDLAHLRWRLTRLESVAKVDMKTLLAYTKREIENAELKIRDLKKETARKEKAVAKAEAEAAKRNPNALLARIEQLESKLKSDE